MTEEESEKEIFHIENKPRQAKTRVMDAMQRSWEPEPRNTDSSIPFLNNTHSIGHIVNRYKKNPW